MQARRYGYCFILCSFLFSLSACETSQPILSCDAKGELKPLCGFQNPEDLEPLGDGRTLVVSQMGLIGQHEPGSLGFYDTELKHLKVFPDFNEAGKQRWGQSSCSPPGPAFSPHGIHLSRVNANEQRLLVVNHGGRESVESFLITQNNGSYDIAWQGCVIVPENSYINDVVAAPNDGFFTTHMFAKEGFPLGPINWPQLQGLMGMKTGWVWHWQSETGEGGGFSKLKGSEIAFPNGIQIDREAKYLFINAWGNNELLKFDWQAGEVVGRTELMHPDNIQWDGAGRLLLASQDFSLADMALCMEPHKGACPGAFKIYSVDPESLQSQVILDQQGAPMGAATVAQPLGEFLYMGTFSGDRLLRMPWKVAPSSE